VWFLILLTPSKNSLKNLASYCFVPFVEFLSFKIDVNVPFKSYEAEKLF